MSALSALRRLSLRLCFGALALLAAGPVLALTAQDVALDKQCGAPVVLPNGDYALNCVLSLSVEAQSGPMMSDIHYSLHDVVTDATGTPQPGWITSAPGCTPMPGSGPGWECTVPSILWQETIPNAVTVPLTTVSLVIPAGSDGPVENCITLSQRAGFPLPGAEPPAEQLAQACASIDLPSDTAPPFQPGGQCLAFTPEVTCDPATGLPRVTLSNAYSGLFAPDSVRITALTPGVSVTSGSGPMSVILTGAAPGDTVTLMSEAVQPGAGSAPGLDLCCLGEIEVKIPPGLQCEIEAELTVEKTCTLGEYPSGANVDCEITVTYDGPPPTASTPLTVSDTVSNGAWSVDAFMGSTHNWVCDATPHAGPAPWGCTITASDEPGADWSAFTSTIIVQMSTEEMFENCAVAEAGGGLLDESCWGTIPPTLTIDKTGPAECDGDGLCDYQITLTAGAGGYFGSVLLSDYAPTGFQITAVSPAIPGCVLPANPMSCAVGVGLAPSTSQTYTVTIQRDGTVEGAIAGQNCAAVHDLPSGPLPSAEGLAALLHSDPLASICIPVSSDDEEPCEDGFALVDGVCAPVETEEPSYSLAKTCEMGAAGIDCTITLTTNGVPFTGQIVVTDESNLSVGGAHTISAPVGTCSDTTMQCSFTYADLAGLTPPNTVQITVTLDATSMVEGFMNCALGSHPLMGAERDCMINGDFDIPGDPPPPNASCSSDYVFVVDSSGSIGTNASDVSVAVRNMAQILNGNGSQASLVLFNSSATLAQPMSAATLNGMANNYGMLFTPGGATNWEAALTLAAAQTTANTTIIFITDGRPTAHLDSSGTPVILPDGPATWLTATNEAIPVVNQIYASGVPIIGVGIAGPGEGSFVSTYLDALLGVNTAGSTFATLNADMTALAYTLCADLHLTKLINNAFMAQVNFHSVTGNSYPLTVTLRALNSTAADLTNVVIEDVLPANLTNPGNVLPVGAPVTFSGQTVTWTVPLIAAGATESITFRVDLARPAPEVTNCIWQTNFAQVQSLTGSIQSTPGNMNPTAGPDAEPDEASARYCAYDRPPNPPADCTEQYLEVRKTVVEEACFVGQPCEFTVNVRPRQCLQGGFSGPVMFADAVTLQGGASVAAPVTAITNNHTTPICAFPGDWTGTTLPTGCATNVTVPQNTSITFNVVLTAPAAGDYTNCFVAQNLGLPATPAAAIAAVNPPTQPNWWQPRGNCVNFSVSEPAGIAPEGSTGDTRSMGAVLTISKTVQDACRTLTAARRHECDFALVVTNTGDAPFAGPVALSDVVAGITPLSAWIQSATNWTCDMRGTSASCVNGSVTLEPGRSAGLVMTLSLPASTRPVRFQNCAALGVGGGEDERTLLVQRVMPFFGIDGGPVDGISGRQTRAGLRMLSERLGLTPEERVTPALLAALGLGDAGAPDCVSVDLPAVSRPASPPPSTPPSTPPTTPPAGPVAGPGCDASTTVTRGDACVCRYEGMVRLDARRCGCGEGQRFEAGRGCVRAAVGGDVTPTGPRCDPQTTVRVGDRCECRVPGMVRRSETACACPQGTQLLGGLGCVGLSLPGVTPRAVP